MARRRAIRRRPRGLPLRAVLAVLLLLGGLALFRLFPSPALPPLPDGEELRSQIAQLNSALLAEITRLTAEIPHEDFTVEDTGDGGVLLANWRDMVAVSIIGDRSLEDVFSAMAPLHWQTSRVDPQNAPLLPSANGGLPASDGKTVLHLSVRCLSAKEGANALGLSRRAQRTLERLLAQQGQALEALLCAPTVPTGQAAEWANALPADLPPLPRALVTHALSLNGRVAYFWGGKSACTDWDPRWGVPALVRADGVSESGSVLPYGLDCSGLVSWAAVAASGDTAAYAAVGDGVRQQFSACTPVDLDKAQPGDLLFFPDQSHIGIAAGWGKNGKVRVVHCSRSKGGVVLGEDAQAAGFTSAGRPALYSNSFSP